MISPLSSANLKCFFYPKIAVSALPLLFMLTFNPLTYAADHIDKNLSINQYNETKALDKSISLTKLNSLKVFYRQLEQRDRDAAMEKVASLFQEYELLFLALVGSRNGNSYSYDAVRKAYSGEYPILVPMYKSLLEKDRYAYKMSLLGYSAKEISDVITGRITVRSLDNALKMRGRGRSEKEISNYLDSTYKRNITRKINPIQPEKRPQALSSAVITGPPHLEALVVKYAERYGMNPAIIRAIVMAESNWSPHAISKKGAVGLMQLMPGTAHLLRIDPHHPEQNIEGGVRYFSFLLNMFKDVDLALIAYNAGPGYAERYSRGKAFLYGETRQYVLSVKKYMTR